MPQANASPVPLQEPVGGSRPRARRSARGRGRFGDPYLLVAVFAGGAAGALMRAVVTRYIPSHGNDLPWSVLAINVGGAVVLAYAAVRLQERLPPSTYRRPFVGTGFCGALTTFSTLQVQVVELGKSGHVPLAALYLTLSIVVGSAAVVLTTAATRRARLR